MSAGRVRIALGILILVDLFSRWPWLAEHYAGGFIPMEHVVAESQRIGWWWSLHALSNNLLWLQALFVLQVVLTLAFILGWRTWWITPLNWLLLCSLQAANSFILDGGDALLRLLLLLCCFLPLGARWSLDARRGNSPSDILPRCYRPAAACLGLQLIAVYGFSLFYKTDPMWTQSFDVLYYAFHHPHYAKPLGEALLAYPVILKAATLFTYAWELLGPLLVLLSWKTPRLRLLCLIIFWLFHGLIFLCFGIELLSFTCMAAWLAFIPREAWSWLGLRADNAKDDAIGLPPLIFAGQLTAALIFCLMLLVNSAGVFNRHATELPAPLNPLTTTLMLNQQWRAFSNEASMSQQSWIAIDGRIAPATWVNLYTGELASEAAPEEGRSYFPNERWRRSTIKLLQARYRPLLRHLAQYHVDDWQATNDQQLNRVRILYYSDPIELPDQEEEKTIRRRLLFQINLPMPQN